jgi:hypothetical protein
MMELLNQKIGEKNLLRGPGPWSISFAVVAVPVGKAMIGCPRIRTMS